MSVTDLQRSIRFYRDVLGVPLLFEVPDQEMAFFQSGQVRLYLARPEDQAFHTRVALYFDVEGIDAEHERLTAAGQAFEDQPHVVHRDEAEELWMAFLRDPDGHHVAIVEHRPVDSPMRKS